MASRISNSKHSTRTQAMKNQAGIVAFLVVLLASSTSWAADPQLACQQRKLMAQGKLEACLTRSAARVLGGKADSSATCRQKFQDALAKADSKASAAGTSCRFLDNGDGTLSDLNTGLMWEQKDTTSCNEVGGLKLRCYGRAWNWMTSLDPIGLTGNLATVLLHRTSHPTFLENEAACLAGHCDWRVPTVEEVRAILDPDCSDGWCLDPLFGPRWDDPSAGGAPPKRMWTRTTWSDLTIQAFLADLTTGEIGVFVQTKTGSARVHLVRGGF